MDNKIIATRIISTDRNGDVIVVVDDYKFDANGNSYTIEKGFRSDGISVPRLFWGLISPTITPESLLAGVIHDWVYRVKPLGWTRKYADDLFYAILMENGFGWVKSMIVWLAVRLFGGFAWKKNSKNKCSGCSMQCDKCYKYNNEDGNK